jgi:ferredoxin
MDDLIIIAAIISFAAFSVAVRLYARHRKTLLVSGENSIQESSSLANCVDAGTTDEPSIERKLDITITFSESGRQYRWIATKESLLEFIESRGIDVECLCRAGECGSCRTKIIEGEVEYHKEPAINPGRGYCLLCVSTPKSDLVLAK